MASSANFSFRFSVRDQETVREALRQLGKDGEAVLKRLDSASDDAAKGQEGIGNAITSTAKAADNAVSSVSGFVKGLIGGALVTTAIALYKQVKDQLTELGDRAQDTRILPQVLQALNLAAADARVPAEKLNSAIDKFTEVSKQGEDGAQNFYKALGNVGKGFVQAFKDAPSQTERLRIIMDALKAAPNEVARAQLAIEAFGTDNERLVSVFDKGRGSMQGFIDQAARLGLTVDDAMIKKADAASRNMGVLSEVIRQKLMAAIGDLMPTARDLLPLLERMAAATRDFFASFASPEARPTSTLENQLKANLSAISDYETEIGRLQQRIANGDFVGKEGGKFFVGQGALQKLVDDDQKAIAQLQADNAAFVVLLDARKRAEAAAGAAPPPKEKGAFQPRPSLTTGGQDEKEAFERESDRIEKHIALMNADAQAVGLSAGEHERLRTEAALVEAMLRNNGDIADYNDKIAAIGEAAAKAAAGLDKARNSAALTNLALEANNLEKQLSEGLASSLRGSTTELLSMAKGTESAAQGFENLGMKILEATANALLMKSVVGPLAGALETGLKGLLNFGGAPVASAKGNVFDSGRLVRFAKGAAGIFDSPRFFPMANGGVGVLGEAGPEAIMPLARDSSGRLGVRGGGGTPNVQVNVLNAPAGTSADVKATPGADGSLKLDVALKRSQSASFRQDLAEGGPMSQAISKHFGLTRKLA